MVGGQVRVFIADEVQQFHLLGLIQRKEIFFAALGGLGLKPCEAFPANLLRLVVVPFLSRARAIIIIRQGAVFRLEVTRCRPNSLCLRQHEVNPLSHLSCHRLLIPTTFRRCGRLVRLTQKQFDDPPHQLEFTQREELGTIGCRQRAEIVGRAARRNGVKPPVADQGVAKVIAHRFVEPRRKFLARGRLQFLSIGRDLTGHPAESHENRGLTEAQEPLAAREVGLWT